MTRAAVLDSTMQKTHEWLGDVADGLGFADERAAYAALRATLHALRDRLPAEAVAHFGAEMPMLIRGLFYEGWHPTSEHLKAAHHQSFLDAIRRELRAHDELGDAERVAQVVFATLDKHLAIGQVEHVLNALPKDVRLLWREEQME